MIRRCDCMIRMAGCVVDVVIDGGECKIVSTGT